MRKFHFIINPISGGGEGKQVLGFLPEIMTSMGFEENEWHAELTKVETAQQVARQALQNSETVVAVGGDGTVSTILKAFLELKNCKTRIGLIPLGTGNDLARVLNLYDAYLNKGLLYLVRQLVQARSRPMDIWQVNGEFAMVNYLSCGLDARIAHDFHKDRESGLIAGSSRFSNKVHYARRFFKDKHHQLDKVRLRYKDSQGEWYSHDLSKMRTVIIGNIPSFASGAQPFLDSEIADGILEVVPVPSLWRFLGALSMGQSFVKVFLPNLKAQELILELDSFEFVQLDGEDISNKVAEKIHIKHATNINVLTL